MTQTSTLSFVHHGVKFDQRQGLGSCEDLANVDYLGLIAFIRPSIFLDLCPPLEDQNHAFDALLDDGASIATGYIVVSLRDERLMVRGHEGRHRMRAILRRCGDDPAPVAIFLRGGDRARDVTPLDLEHLAAGMWREPSSIEPRPPYIPGPLFDRVILRGVETSVISSHVALASGMR